ncbi:MAG: taurine catabolism dioxygenase TauD [Mastigocladus sp. ERB_26_2]
MLTNNINANQYKIDVNLHNEELLDATKLDLNQLTIKISKVAEISNSDLQRLFEIFNKFKFVILECEPIPNLQENLLALQKYFGSIKKHKLSAPNGISTIENLRDSSLAKTYVATSNITHFMHTDGSFEMEPPKIVAMQCEVPSQTGGLSQIIYAETVYEYLRNNYPEELQNLFDYPLTITRGDQTGKRAIFTEYEDRMFMCFRADAIISVAIPPQVERAYNLIKNYVNDTNNQLIFQLQPHQIIILDNASVLHGRTSFPENEFRKLNRLHFNGVSEYSHYFQLGFIPKSKPLSSESN